MTDEEKKARNRPKEHSASNLRTADKTNTTDINAIWRLYCRAMDIEAETSLLKAELRTIAKPTTNTGLPKTSLEHWGFIQ